MGKRTEQKSSDGKKHVKKCSISLAIKEIQIKVTLRLYLTSIRRAIIKNTTPKWLGCGEKGTLIYSW
jgi:hypothetical protein